MLSGLESEDFIKIPIYGEIKAGYGMIGDENIIGYQMESKSRVEDGEYFYLLVKGDSMIEDGIVDGCKVLIRKQNTVPNGKIGVCIINGDEATLKRVVYDGDKIILMASNKNILPKTYDISEVLIQGQVKSVVFDL
jgi:repressor LexA